MSVFPPNSYVESLPPPNMTVLGFGAFGRGLGHEGGAPMSGIRAFVRDTREFAPLLSYLPCEDTGSVIRPLGETPEPAFAGDAISDSSLQICEKYPSDVDKPPHLRCSVRVAPTDRHARVLKGL